MKVTVLGMVVAALLTASAARATNWYVATNGSDVAHAGTNGWGDAYVTISNAVAHAASNDTVVVSNGVYTITTNIVVTNAIVLQALSTNPADTIVQGLYPASTGRCFWVNHSAALVTGFTMTNGHTSLADQYGGSVYLLAGTVSNCAMLGGYAYTYGGNLYMTGGRVDRCLLSNARLADGGAGWSYGGGVFLTAGVLTNCTIIGNGFVNNYHSFGGGVRMTGGSVVNSAIVSNFISSIRNKQGGGIWINGGTVLNCDIRGNYTLGGTDGNNDATKGGGGVWCESSGLLRNCLIRGNETSDAATDTGGGVRLEAGTMQNCSVSGNRAISSGGGVQNNGGTITNTIAFGNTAAASSNLATSVGVGFSCAPELSGGLGNLAVDPLFATNGVGYGTNFAGGNFHLQVSSSCIDAGTNLAAVTIDLDGVARPQDGNGDAIAITDMGCYEFKPDTNALLCSFAANTNVGFAPVTVVFTATVNGNTNGLTYYWDFGNGTLNGAALAVVTNTYGAAGYNSVTLAVSNNVPVGSSSSKPNYVKVFINADVYVSPSGSATRPYQTWATAANDLQAAINLAASDLLPLRPATKVWATNGTYSLGSQLALSQGLTVQSVNGAASTFINAGGIPGQRCLNMSQANAVLDGFSLTNGYAQNYGGGVNISAGTIRNCTIGWNRVSDDGGGWVHGGGVYMTGGTLSNCVISNNRFTGTQNAFWGGVDMSAGTVYGCTLVSNAVSGSTVEQGGGANMTGGTVQNCVLQGNRTSQAGSLANDGSGRYGGGAGLCVAGGACLVQECLVAGNSVVSTDATGGRGGGLRLAAGTVQSCTIVRNQAGATCGGAGVTGGTVMNTIVYFNSASSTNNINTTNGVGYSCAPELTGGLGNITADPAFKDAGAGSGTNATLGNYMLRGGGPCVDTGVNQAWMNSAFDLGGKLRIFRGTVDMGAYENDSKNGIAILMR